MQKEDFDKLTETGKHKAITAAEERAEKAEGILAEVWRHLFGAVMAAKKPDDIISQVVKYVERHAQELDKRAQKEYNIKQ